MNAEPDVVEQEVEVMDLGALGALTRAEIDVQVSTGKAYPRSMQQFMRDAETLATYNEVTAESCSYSVPRAGKVIDGPSARMAEILVYAWTNCRAGARTVEVGDKLVRAQGIFVDTERNVSVSYEVSRRITDKNGRRYKDDMIATTAAAACSIAYRNAAFRGIPMALWRPVWEKARRAAAGTEATLADRRVKALEYLKGLGVAPESVFVVLGVKGIEDVALDELVTLKGLVNAIREGEISVDEAFPKFEAEKPATPTAAGMEGLKAAVAAKVDPVTPETGPAPPVEVAEDASRGAGGTKGKGR